MIKFTKKQYIFTKELSHMILQHSTLTLIYCLRDEFTKHGVEIN